MALVMSDDKEAEHTLLDLNTGWVRVHRWLGVISCEARGM